MTKPDTTETLSLQETTDALIERLGDPYEAYVRMAWELMGLPKSLAKDIRSSGAEHMIARIAARHVAMTILDIMDMADESEYAPLYAALCRVAGD